MQQGLEIELKLLGSEHPQRPATWTWRPRTKIWLLCTRIRRIYKKVLFDVEKN